MDKKFLLISCGLLVLSALVCGIVYVSEWIHTEITYGKWLAENELRVDFGAFHSQEELRVALLEKTPVGTSKDKVIIFYCENVVQQGLRLETNLNDEEECSKSCEKCDQLIRLDVGRTNRGHLLRRFFMGQWIIFFELDANSQELMDIKVDSFRSITP